MKLSEFINKRLEELHMTRTVLVNNFGLKWSTLSNINRGIPISEATKQKLALALQCSQGDIQACLAEAPDDRRKGGSVMEAIEKLDQIVREEHPETVADEDDAGEYGFAVQDQIEEPLPMTVEEYRQRLKDLFLRIASNVSDPYDHVSTLTSAFGKAVLDMLVKEDQDVR
jgi:hypothetical protein